MSNDLSPMGWLRTPPSAAGAASRCGNRRFAGLSGTLTGMAAISRRGYAIDVYTPLAYYRSRDLYRDASFHATRYEFID
jgi:hypothetical protein